MAENSALSPLRAALELMSARISDLEKANFIQNPTEDYNSTRWTHGWRADVHLGEVVLYRKTCGVSQSETVLRVPPRLAFTIGDLLKLTAMKAEAEQEAAGD